MDHRIHQGMRHLPTEQKSNPPHQNSIVPNPIKHQRQTVLPHRHGSHHWATRERRTRRHTNHSQPRMLTGGHLPPLFYNHHGRRNSATVPGTSIPMVRTPTKDHQRQRPPIHISLRTRINQRLGDQSEPVNGVSPSDRRVIRTNESMGQTILTPYYRKSERME
jgi:hypothetical protein